MTQAGGGLSGDAAGECRCPPVTIQRYLGRISAPLLARIDSPVGAPAVPYKELRGNSTAESSVAIRARVEQARAVQQARRYDNSRMPSRSIRKHCALDDYGERTLQMAALPCGLYALTPRPLTHLTPPLSPPTH